MMPTRRAQIEEIFDMVDVDGNGTVESDEIYAMLCLVKDNMSHEEMKKQFNEMDEKHTTHTGHITREGFVSYFLTHFASDDEKKFWQRAHHTSMYVHRKTALGHLFDKFDVNHDGKFDRGELYHMIVLSNPQFRNSQLNKLFNKMDSDHDGRVSRKEFVQYYFQEFIHDSDDEFDLRLEQTHAGRRKMKLRSVFNAYDTDGNGTLDTKEFASMLTMNGRKFISADEILETILALDSNRDRAIDFAEWSRYMAGIIAHMDDKRFDKAVRNMLRAAQSKGSGHHVA
jgi:Ca2+-binding EF-hand superfamily protein